MSLAPRLDLRQSQSLVMTPQLQQAIKLLALSNLELEGVIAEELEKNPLLAAGGEDGEPQQAEAPSEAGDDPGDDFEPMTADRLIEAGDAETDAPLDVDYDAETFHHDSAGDMLLPVQPKPLNTCSLAMVPPSLMSVLVKVMLCALAAIEPSTLTVNAAIQTTNFFIEVPPDAMRRDLGPVPA